MAKNSLFAILLRSPWWISFAVVAVFALASGALLPPQYVVFGLMGAIPFFVIGCVAAWRQMRAPSARTVEQTLERAATMPWRDFRDLLEQAYRNQGYTVTRLDGQAADLQLTQGAQTTLVAAKRWKAASHGVEPLRALDHARRTLDTSHAVYITLGELNDATRRFADKNTISLINGVALVQLLGRLP
jgi:restriction system protein